MINYFQKQAGSAHVVIIVVIVAAVLGALGYVFWQNFINKDTSEITNDSKQTTTQSAETPANPVEQPKDSTEGYLVLEDWGIKFKLPEDSGEIRYYKENVTNDNGSFDYYSFSTKRVEELGEQCSADSEKGQIHLASVSRFEAKRDQVANSDLQEEVQSMSFVLNTLQR